MKLKVLQFFTVMLFALVTGVFWGTWFSLSRSITSISPGTFLEIGHTIINNLAVPMRFLMPGAIVLSVLTMAFMPRKSTAFYFTLSGTILMIVAMIITLSVNVPIDNQIKVWTVNSLPSNWDQIRDRWESFHAVRTSVSIAGLASILIGVLTGVGENKQ